MQKIQRRNENMKENSSVRKIHMDVMANILACSYNFVMLFGGNESRSSVKSVGMSRIIENLRSRGRISVFPY